MARLDDLSARDVQMDGGVDAPRLMNALWAHKGAIVIPTTLATAAALALIIAVPARYTSVAKVVLETQQNYLAKSDKVDAAPALDDAAVANAAESIATPDIARKAIAQLELDRVLEFHPSSLERFVGSTLAGAKSGAYDDIVVETFLNRLNVFPVAHSRVLQIEFSAHDPALAARIANTVAELFLKSQGDARQGAAKTAAEWLSSHIEPLRAKLVETGAELQSRKVQVGLLPGANGVNAPTQKLTELTSQIAMARATLSAATAKAASLRDYLTSGRADVIPEVARDESLRRYLEARVALKAEIAENGRTLLSEHPRMRELEGQLAGLDAEIRSAAQKAVTAFESDARIASEQVKNLDAQIRDQSRVVAATDTDEVKLRSLELEEKTEREQLETYMDKYREAVARESVDAEPPNARIIETASAAGSPSFPKRGPTLMLAALAGFVLSLGVAVARALTADSEPARPMTPEQAYAAALAGGALGPAADKAPQVPANWTHAPPAEPARGSGRATLRKPNPGAIVVPPPIPAGQPAPMSAHAEYAARGAIAAAAMQAPPEPSPARSAPDTAWPETSSPTSERMRIALPGAAPVQVTDRDPLGNFITPESEALLTGAVDDFLGHAPQGPLTILVCGEGAPGALSAALGAGRRFAKKGATVMVDLGVSQPWLSDLVERNGLGFVGLFEVASGSVRIEQGLHHDLVSRLDIMPAGAEPIQLGQIEEIVERLGERYPFVIVHCSDWRTATGRQALQTADGALVCASGPRIAPIRAGVSRAVGARPFILVDLTLEKGELSERAA